MGSLAGAWSEGYATALADFDIQATEDQIKAATKNPHTYPEGKRRLSAYERAEIRRALGWHFEDCPGDWDMQTEIVETVTERIISRRPEREG